jgi:hypothetical protein
MSARFDLYGSRVDDLDNVRTLVESVLGVTLAAHESGYHGGSYYRFDSGKGEHIILKKNFDPIENEWFEEKFKSYPILLYINETHRSDEFQKQLQSGETKFDLLRREEI